MIYGKRAEGNNPLLSRVQHFILNNLYLKNPMKDLILNLNKAIKQILISDLIKPGYVFFPNDPLKKYATVIFYINFICCIK